MQTEQVIKLAMKPLNIFGLILAGGKGRRIESIIQHKFLLQVEQKTLIEHCIETLRKSISTIHISCNDFTPIEQALNKSLLEKISTSADGSFLSCGPLAGVYSALQFYGKKQENVFTHALSVPADSPFISTTVINTLILEAKKNPFHIISCSNKNKIHYACSMWPTNCFTQLNQYLLKGNRSIKGFFDEHDTKIIHFDDTQNWFLNINTPEDYYYAKKLFENDEK